MPGHIKSQNNEFSRFRIIKQEFSYNEFNKITVSNADNIILIINILIMFNAVKLSEIK